MNELEIKFRTRVVHIVPMPVIPQMPTASPDRRYRCLVTLMRSDRPRYWNYLCSNCGSKVVELQNLDVYAIDDFYDPQNINNTGIGRHCKGTTSDGIACHYSYFFNVR